MFTIGIIQDHADADAESNLRRAEKLVRVAAGRGAQIICLKELFNALYFCKSQQCDRFDLAEPIPGPTTDAMQALARELAVVIIVPIFERQTAGIYRNSAAVIDADGTLLGVYRKMHIPDDPLFNEKYYFTPGDAAPDDRIDPIGQLAQQASGVRVWEKRDRQEDEPGTDGIEFFGNSFIADPFGRLLAEAGTDPEILIAKCDPRVIEDTRRNWPFLRDRRIDAYAPILSRYLGA